MNADKSKKASKNVTTETKKENQDTKKGEKNANKINNISNNINNNTNNKQYKEEGSNLRSKKKNDQFEKEKKVPPKKNFLDNFDGRYQKFVELVNPLVGIRGKRMNITELKYSIDGNKQADRPTMLGYINDQVPKWENIHHWLTFLNQETPVFTGIERITRQLNQAVVYIDVKRLRRGYYECEYQVITRDPSTMGEYELTDIYFQRMEQTINRAPQFWLWSHNRWKRTREEFDRRFKVVNGRVVEK